MTYTIDIEKALQDPSQCFNSPMAVCHAGGISRDVKIRILRRWEYDAREQEVAEEENMPGGDYTHLDEVLDALQCLHAEMDLEHGPPTKQGGE